MGSPNTIESFIAAWRDTGGSELANTQSFINGLCGLLGVDPPSGSRTDDAHNHYVFERRVFQDNGTAPPASAGSTATSATLSSLRPSRAATPTGSPPDAARTISTCSARPPARA
jgi:hypothetical protein